MELFSRPLPCGCWITTETREDGSQHETVHTCGLSLVEREALDALQSAGRNNFFRRDFRAEAEARKHN